MLQNNMLNYDKDVCYMFLNGLFHRRVCIQVCLQIEPESYEWGLT